VSGPASVIVRRVMPAPPPVVYDEWLDPGALADWMCPRPAVPTNIECDAHVGGVYRIDIEDTGVRMAVTGRYLLLDRPHLISFTWYCSIWGPDVPESIVTVTFESHGTDETLMTIEHTQLQPDVLEGHRHGWSLTTDQLAAVLPRRNTQR
jgi:uncharacterized protein YndB with AHSA1/START domain